MTETAAAEPAASSRPCSDVGRAFLPGLSAARQQAELVAILDRARAIKLNAILLQIRPAGDALYDELTAAGLDVLYDDREETAGVKFNDADLIGLPMRLVVSERLLAADQIELKRRGGEVEKLARTEIVGALRVTR